MNLSTGKIRIIPSIILGAFAGVIVNIIVANSKKGALDYNARMVELNNIFEERGDHMYNFDSTYAHLLYEVECQTPDALYIMNRLDVAAEAAMMTAHYHTFTLICTFAAAIAVFVLFYTLHR